MIWETGLKKSGFVRTRKDYKSFHCYICDDKSKIHAILFYNFNNKSQSYSTIIVKYTRCNNEILANGEFQKISIYFLVPQLCTVFCFDLLYLQRWVWAYWKGRFNVVINNNNGIERQNRSFKHDFLSNHCDTSLSGMLSVLVTVSTIKFPKVCFKKQ